MADTVETVIIERKDHENGYCVINKDDLKDGDKVLKEIPAEKVKRGKSE